MTAHDTLERQLVESLADAAASGSPDYLDDILGRSSRTRQRRAWPLQPSVFPARVPHERAGWRTGRSLMVPIIRIAAVASLVVALGVAFGPRQPIQYGITGPSPSPTTSPEPMPDGLMPAGTYTMTLFAEPGSDACFHPPQAGCVDATDDDAVRVTVTVPDGWRGTGPEGGDLSSGRVAMIITRGASLATDPCHNDGTDVIPVGPTVDDFVGALEAHPLLSVTEAEDVTIGGHPGKYLELQVPDDPTIQGESEPANLEGCPVYRPWEPWYLAQGPSELWRLWVVDVDGVRVVIQGIERTFALEDRKDQLQAIAESARVERFVTPGPSQSPAT